MKGLKDINRNPISDKWKEKYERCSSDIKKRIDKLDDMPVKEYQLQTIKRQRIYPEKGDIFQICPNQSTECYGLVVNNHINNINGEDLIVIFVFKPGISVEKIIDNNIDEKDLLIAPEIVGKEYWTRGYFYNTDHTNISINNYGFYSIGQGKFLDEYGNAIRTEPFLIGTYGVATISGVAYAINRELILQGIL